MRGKLKTRAAGVHRPAKERRVKTLLVRETEPEDHKAHGLHHWRKLAEELHVNPDAMIQRVDDFTRQLADQVSHIRGHLNGEGLTHPIITRLAEALTARATAHWDILCPRQKQRR